MRFGIPLLGDRVAPRCTVADGIVFGTVKRGRITYRRQIRQEVQNGLDLSLALRENQVDTLLCGGISRDTRELLEPYQIDIIPNVVGTIDEILDDIAQGIIRPGVDAMQELCKRRTQDTGKPSQKSSKPPTPQKVTGPSIDCIACENKTCLQGKGCSLLSESLSATVSREQVDMLEVARDISFEDERRLCRLSELVYFCLEMGYRSVGVAYCTDMTGPVETLTRVLRRFFDVYPVCCKLHWESLDELHHEHECNPVMQAQVLNEIGTDVNVIVGLCIGSDCVFTRHSNAPVTTLFVKDKALANNPVGAVYSDRYLEEASNPSGRKVGKMVELAEQE